MSSHRQRPLMLLSVALLLSAPGAVSAADDVELTLRLVETDEVIEVKRGRQSVLTYNKVSPAAPDGIDAIYQRSGCLHPVMTPRGATVTAMFPVDHPHQHGVFSAWVKTTYDGEPVDFWNLAGGTGRVLHERVVSKGNDNGAVTFAVDLLHRKLGKSPIDVLRERWHITVHPTVASHHCFDLALTQTAITDKPLIVEEYHYGGVALRGPVEWLIPTRSPNPSPNQLADRVPSRFLNNLGSNRKQGNHQHAQWVALTGRVKSPSGESAHGDSATIVVLSHPSNFRSPQAARLHPTKPYFSYTPCVDGAFHIDRKHPYKARYRYLVTDSKPDPDWIHQQWKQWSVTQSMNE